MEYCNTCDKLIDENKSCPYCTKQIPHADTPLMIDNLDAAALNRARQSLGIGSRGYDEACGKNDNDHQMYQGAVKQTVGRAILQPFIERCQIMRN